MDWKEAVENCIFKYISGSHAYGTSTPESDKDYRGVFIAPLHYGFELFQTKQTSGTLETNLKKAMSYIKAGFSEDAIEQLKAALAEDGGDLTFGVSTVRAPKEAEEDAELQELRKFLKLAAANNPNIIEFLYIDQFIEIEKPIWKKIKAHRDFFLSKRVRYSFSGYAVAQLKKIHTHRQYIMNPPQKRPTRTDFGLPENSKIPPENQNAIYSLSDEWVKPEMKELVLKEKSYFKALREYKQYHEWEEERNPARKELERAHGYDTKHAMHLVRLVRMAEEMLQGKGCLVHRPDAEDLKAIRYGKWTYDELEKYASGIDDKLNALYKTSPLPEKPNHKKIANLYKEICEEVYNINLSGQQQDAIDANFAG